MADAELVTVFLNVEDGYVVVRFPSPDGPVLADFSDEVRPGQYSGGYSYDELVALGTGRHELPNKPLPEPCVVLFQDRECRLVNGRWSSDDPAAKDLLPDLQRYARHIAEPGYPVDRDSYQAWETARFFRGDVAHLRDNAPAERDAAEG